jgi:hypothetical protein
MNTLKNALKLTRDYYIYVKSLLKNFLLATNWDISAIAGLQDRSTRDAVRRGRLSCKGEDANHIYGDVWLLENICKKTGLEDDLLSVFGGDRQKVADLLTLAFFSQIPV